MLWPFYFLKYDLLSIMISVAIELTIIFKKINLKG
jgi:hypothetical protein|nr:MAG TPA: hypothetical protein [Caudoviricetes sp.]